MKKEILILVLLVLSFTVITAQTDFNTYYKLSLNYSEGDINISSVEIEFSQEKIENSFGFYFVEILDYNNDLLNITFFNVPNEILYDTIDPETGEIGGGGSLELDDVLFEIYIPYYENAKDIIIYEGLSEMVREGISEFSKEQPEKDILGEDRDEEGKKKEDLEKQAPKESFTERVADYWWVLAIILVILLIILVYSLRKKDRKTSPKNV